MARPLKQGLDYFPLDVVIDDNIELLEAECGLIGFAILIKIWQKIYSNGYYIDWEEDNALLFARKINIELTVVNDVVNVSLRRSLFNKKLYKNYKILTSSGIQKRYFKICSDSKRKNLSIIKEYKLFNPELIGVNPELTSINSELSTQSKEEYIKEYNNKTNDNDFEIFFDKCWKLYPNKKGKGSIKNAAKKRALKLGEEFIRTIERYSIEMKGKEKQYMKHGSTFWNSGYVDYIDENYQNQEKSESNIESESECGFKKTIIKDGDMTVTIM